MALGVGTGSVLTIGARTFDEETTTFTVTPANPAIDTTTLATTGGRTYISPTLTNYTISAEGYWPENEAFPTCVGAAETVTWQIRGDTNDYGAEGVITSCPITAPLEELTAFSVEIQVSGIVSSPSLP